MLSGVCALLPCQVQHLYDYSDAEPSQQMPSNEYRWCLPLSRLGCHCQ